MRTLKFRAWIEKLEAKKNEKGEFAGWNVVGGQMKEVCPCKFFKNTPREAIMQFTGLLDKNGVEIYEGDIVNGVGESPHEIKWIDTGYWTARVIKKNNYGYAGRALFHIEEFPDIEIIGNVHSTPELLELRGQ